MYICMGDSYYSRNEVIMQVSFMADQEISSLYEISLFHYILHISKTIQC